MKIIKSLPVALISSFALAQCFGQQITILSDAGQPIKDAHAHFIPVDKKVINNTKNVLLSNANGELNLPYPQQTEGVLTINALGYKAFTDTFKLNSSDTIHLYPEAVAINDVVITAQYAPNSAEKSVYKIKVIDRKKIDAMGAQTLRDALTNELNIRISQDNVLGSSLSMQGISGQNIKILIDGVPMIGRQNGNLDLSQINMNNVDHIEIVEGPLSVNYGTDALGGAINIITKKTQKKH